MAVAVADLDRFMKKVEIIPGGCWNWQSAQNNMGYGMFHLGGSTALAHRFSYEYNRGPIPAGLTLDHLCRTPLCANPRHLEPVTQKENVKRGNARFNGEYNRVKTHCKHGHPYNEANTYIRQDGRRKGHRLCKKCKKCILNNSRRSAEKVGT